MSEKQFGESFTTEELAEHYEALIGSAKGLTREQLIENLKETEFEEFAFD